MTEKPSEVILAGLVEHFLSVKAEIAECEAVKKSIQAELNNHLGKDEAKLSGDYKVVRITQDRRTPDLAKLTAIAVKRNIDSLIEAAKHSADSVMLTKEGVSFLLENDQTVISESDIAENLKGQVISYIDVKAVKKGEAE